MRWGDLLAKLARGDEMSGGEIGQLRLIGNKLQGLTEIERHVDLAKGQFGYPETIFTGAVTLTKGSLDMNSNVMRLRTAKTPGSAGASGNAGDICWDASYIYVCTATDTWERVGIASW